MVNALSIGMFLHVTQFSITEPVVGMNENIQYSPHGFNTAEEASAPASQSRYVVA